jgi:hypothetical protein
MKQILFILSIFFSTFIFPATSQCIDGVGHVVGDIDSIHVHECDWFIDTSYVRVARLEYDGYEYSVYPEACDTSFYSCVRCDSFVAQPSSEVRRFIRALGNVPSAPVPEPEASYKVYTAILTQSGENAPTATVLENTIGTVTYSYITIGQYGINCSTCFTENKTILTYPINNAILNAGNNPAGMSTSIFLINQSTSQVILQCDEGDQNDVITNCLVEIRVYP